MKAEESRYIRDEFGVRRLVRGGRVIPAQWEEAYEKGEPVPERTGPEARPERDKAQKALGAYLESRHLKPTIVIHRGHSYHVKYTISQMPATARVVVLGSCGGYNNLSEVLKINEDAHIISSKQVGTKTVNEPILQAINNTLLAGKDIEWLPMWRELSARFQNDPAAKEKFDDYIPPYKNLGAIFIKAYQKAMDNE